MSESELDKHAETVHNCCTDCDCCFDTPAQLVQHDVEQHNMCGCCRAYFDSPSNLKSVLLSTQSFTTHSH